MKTKKLFTLAALLTSSLASAVDLADLENKYYVGLNFGGEYSGGLNLRPNLLIGYHYKKSSKLELEINSNIHSLENIGVGLLANYRYYPDIDLGPVTLYVSGGLGSYIQIIGGTSSDSGGIKKDLESSGGSTTEDNADGKGASTGASEGDTDAENKLEISNDDIGKTSAKETVQDNDSTGSDSNGNVASRETSDEEIVVETRTVAAPVMYTSERISDRSLAEGIGIPVKVVPIVSTSETASDQSSTNKILGHIAYKLKIGVDYQFTPRIIGAVGLNLGGSLNSLSQVGTGIEVGIRYNF